MYKLNSQRALFALLAAFAFLTLEYFCQHRSQDMLSWYFSHWWATKAQANLRVRTDSPKYSLLACTMCKYECSPRLRPNFKSPALLDTRRGGFCTHAIHAKSIKISWGDPYTAKPMQNGQSKKDRKLVFKTNYHLMQIKDIAEFIKLVFVIKIAVWTIFEWPFYMPFLSFKHPKIHTKSTPTIWIGCYHFSFCILFSGETWVRDHIARWNRLHACRTILGASAFGLFMFAALKQ